jgi:hypothetical protein
MDEMGGTCGTHWGEAKCVHTFGGKIPLWNEHLSKDMGRRKSIIANPSGQAV